MYILAITEMSWPADIPWKGMGVPSGIIHPQYNHSQFPPKWKPPIAAPYLEPADVSLDYCNKKIMHIKTSCTTTNYQSENASITILDESLYKQRSAAHDIFIFE